MAQVFPFGSDGAGSAASETLVWTLRTLPDPWTLLRDRRIDASGEVVDLVLVHPKMGVVLIDEAPRDPAAKVAQLCDFLERQRFADFFPGTLPIVSLSVAINELPTLDEKLARAFDASSMLSIENPDWADALTELLLLPNAVGAEAPDAPSVMPDFAGPRQSLAVDIGHGPAEEEPVAAAVGRTADASHAPTMQRRHMTPAVIALSAVSVLAAGVAALALRGSATLNDAAPPSVERTALMVPLAVAATPPATASPPRSSAAVHHPRHPAVRHVRCADWLHQNRPGGSDYHGPPVAGCRRWH
jgi:hypothetical protein